VDIAVRRILEAVSERVNPIDGFVDAVIAWENLFGSTEGELTFRISAAMASLLESTPERRIERQKQLKKLYGERSRIVHGGSEPKVSEALRMRNEALSAILACLRRLYVDFPNLLRDSARATTILFMS
jgi:hypothetical protein